jgi:hypothetical protein
MVTRSVAGVVVGLVYADLVGVDGGGGVAALLHLDGAVPLLDPDLNTGAAFSLQPHLAAVFHNKTLPPYLGQPGVAAKEVDSARDPVEVHILDYPAEHNSIINLVAYKACISNLF